jgi:hypothetical protein
MNARMANFNWLDTRQANWFDRFPRWAYGRGHWVELGDNRWTPGAPLGLPSLHARADDPQWKPACPRLFVSHRKDAPDADYALRIAKIAVEEDFEFWLDVLNPDLDKLKQRIPHLTPEMESLATARIIEMGLINSTHVIALMTPRTRGTLWIPYEYGRVKDAPVDAVDAGCWLHPKLDPVDFADYLRLGVVTYDEAGIRAWLQTERASWQKRGVLKPCAEAWSAGVTKRLPV